MDEFLYYLDSAIVIWFVTQIAYSVTILLAGNVMIEYYEWAIYEKPSTKYEKTINFIMGFLIGAGPYVYKKFYKHPWWKRKLFMLGSVLAMTIGSVIIYKLLMVVVRTVF